MSTPGPASSVPAVPSPADVRVVRGSPDDMELAALVAGLVAAAGGPALPEEAQRSAWSDRARTLAGARAARSADAWRWSLRS